LTGIRELARHLDLSIGTVSRALNDKADVNPGTRERVREAAAQLGYSPNQSGRSLRRGQTDLVGVIVPTAGDRTFINSVFLSVLDGLRRRLSADQLDLAIFLHGPEEDVFGSLRRLTERGIFDGLIIADTLRIDPRIDYLLGKKTPFVAFGRSLSGGGHPWVDPDFEAAVEGSIEKLVDLGHRRIALMLAVGETNYMHLILESYRRAMARHGLAVSPDYVQRRPVGEKGGHDAGEAFLAAEKPPTAILVSEAMQTIGLYRRLSDAALQPGRDVSLIGILTEERARFLAPSLASFQTDWTGIGARLGDALVGAIGRPSMLTLAGASSLAGAIQTIAPVALLPGESLHRPSS
jgi:DNA-binding LacI/PurR family transcriptional regulator